jgi:hypothetical protein
MVNFKGLQLLLVQEPHVSGGIQSFGSRDFAMYSIVSSNPLQCRLVCVQSVQVVASQTTFYRFAPASEESQRLNIDSVQNSLNFARCGILPLEKAPGKLFLLTVRARLIMAKSGQHSSGPLNTYISYTLHVFFFHTISLQLIVIDIITRD